VDYPRRTVSVAGGRPLQLSVIDAGPERPRGTAVLIHGAGGDAMQWRHQIAHLAPSYRVVAPDLRGHGLSDAPRSSYSLEEFLWDFQQVLDQLEVERPFALLAHSFGGPIALTFAASQPAQVARMMLVATAPEIHLSPAVELALRLPIPFATLERLRPLFFPKLRAPLFVLKRVLAGTLFPWRGWDILPQVQAPTLIIGGQLDLIVPAVALQRMRARMPSARVELVRYAGHLPQLERPDSVNRLVDSFLEERRRSWRGEHEDVR
jgi:pimeloyl-ACP methyl ester carboxylesterase